jgi:subtilase family serine protease
MMLPKSTAAALALSIATISALAPVSAATLAPQVRTAASAPSTAWFTTPTKAFSAKNLIDLGAVQSTLPLHVVVGLQLSNKSAALAMAKAISTPGNANYHHFLTPGQFNAYFAPSSATANAMAQYLAAAGFKNVSIAPNNLIVSADATAATAATAFNTTIHAVKGNGFTTFANVSPAQLPAQFTGLVTGVIGLNGNMAHTAIVHPTAQSRAAAIAKLPASMKAKLAASGKSAVSCGSGLSVGLFCEEVALSMNELDDVYGDAGTTTGSKTNIGVFTEGSLAPVINDLRINEYYNGRAQVPVSIVTVGGTSSDTSGVDEWDLDTQASTAMAGTVKSLTMYNTQSLSDPFTTAMFNKWVTDDKVQVTSASFGECEAFAFQDGAMFTDDNIFLNAFLQGQSIFASSGDTGGSCFSAANGTPVGVPGVEYPSSSPFVVAVGGTSLLVTSSDGVNFQYYGELGWYSGGGGPSAFELNCPFQNQALACTATRGVPDIAFAADPNLGSSLDVVVSGTYEGVGGTSLAAPMANGVYSRLQSRLNNTAGAALPNIYNSYAYWNSNATTIPLGGIGLPISLPPVSVPIPTGTSLDSQIGGFTDVLVGDNVPYPCLPGYDYVTGLGSLNTETFVDHFPLGQFSLGT